MSKDRNAKSKKSLRQKTYVSSKKCREKLDMRQPNPNKIRWGSAPGKTQGAQFDALSE
jgi:ribosomal protein L24E